MVPATKNPIRKLYDWTLHWADTRYAYPALAVVAFTESSFFPIPPDVLLLAMVFANSKRWIQPAVVCSIFSVLGAVLGWAIGYALYESVGTRIIDFFHAQHAFEQVGVWYQENAFLALLGAAFTPIPFKVFTIAAGVYHEQVGLATLVAASLIGRSGRFFLVAGIIRIFGEKARVIVEKHFNWLSLAAFALLIGGFLALKAL